MEREEIISNAESDNESNQQSHHSRSVRKLYNRMGNNIRVLNKSRVSNRSNNSIGSVALRRTELSNDKIYSREEEFFNMNDNSRVGDFDSEVNNNMKGSINAEQSESSKNNNNNNSRQRIKLSKESFSRRSSSQKSYRQSKQHIGKKLTKHDIEKLFMMEEIGDNDNDNNNGKENNKRGMGDKLLIDSNSNSRENEKRYYYEKSNNNNNKYKESIRSSRQRHEEESLTITRNNVNINKTPLTHNKSRNIDNNSNSNTSKLRSFKEIKESIKSNIRSSKNLNIRESQHDKNSYRYYTGEEEMIMSGNSNNEMVDVRRLSGNSNNEMVDVRRLSRKYNDKKEDGYYYNKNVDKKENKTNKYGQEDNYHLMQQNQHNNKNQEKQRSSEYQLENNKKNSNKDENYYYGEVNQKDKEKEREKYYREESRHNKNTNHKETEREIENNNNQLHRYKSEKHISTTTTTNMIDSEINTKREHNSRRRYDDEGRTSRNNDSYYDNKIRDKRGEYDNKHYDKRSSNNKNMHSQNSLEKYQREQWTQEANHRQQYNTKQGNNNNQKHISQKLLLMEESSIVEDKRLKNDYTRDRYKQLYTNDHQRSSVLLLKSKNNNNPESQLKKNIHIKEKEWAYLYGDSRQESSMMIADDNRERGRRSSKKLSERTDNKLSSSSRIQSPFSPRTPKNHLHHQQQQNEYYAHMMTPTSTGTSANNRHHVSHQKPSPTTQISSTLDSLLLSINSHISLAQHEKSSATLIIDKLNLHIKTLELISDYSKEFKKMYEDVEEWEQLIFLSYKKYWVERVRVVEYLKKYINVQGTKRHSNSQKISLKAPSPYKNIKDSNQPLSSPLIDNPFSSETLLENPFTIPFCKLSEEELNKLSRCQEAPILLKELERETSTTYSHLQELYNQYIANCHNPNFNMLYCDNFSDEIYLEMLTEIEKLLPNLEEFKMFEVTKIRLGKIVKAGILMLHINGKYVRNISEIVTFDDCEKIGEKKKIKTFTTYDLYYEVFEKMVVE